MPIVLKSADDIARMHAAGAVVAAVHERLRSLVRPGVTTCELDRAAKQVIDEAGGYPSFLGYRGFPASICTSVNEEILHGIPGERVLQEGDLLSIDVGVQLNGFHADAARTLAVGAVTAEASALSEAAEACFWEGFRHLELGGRLGDAGAAVEALAASRGFSVVREYAGHGVGRKMHEDPSVPNYGLPGTGTLLRGGMTFALEPMLCAGGAETRVLDDGWTVVTLDGRLSAHYEHTVAITGHGAIVLTDGASDVL